MELTPVLVVCWHCAFSQARAVTNAIVDEKRKI